jgi:uncharacterized protein (DUF1800 family)
VCAVLLLALAVPPAHAAEPVSDRQAIHILDRLAYGPSAEDLRHLKSLGIERYIAEQLDPASITEPPELTARVAALDTLALTPVELFQQYGPPRPADGSKPTPEQVRERREKARTILQQAQEARLLRAVYSRRQLAEVMVDFWYNHFNVFANKGQSRLWFAAYEAQAIRPNAFGHFRDLLVATARHPAMLFYLDNAQNAAPGSKRPDGGEAGLNENYARELMELHTLGANGGYTQDDVVALARILTGWTIARTPKASPDGSGFAFSLARHDTGPKKFLGHEIEEGGEAEGLAALDILARHPATARRIAFELSQYFVADQPPPALVERLAARFAATDGNIGEVLKTLFASREFRDSIGGKYKTPYRYVVSAVRAAGVPLANPKPLLSAMARQGMPLYGCQTPDGYRDTADAWLSPDASLLRVSFATALASGNLPVAAAQQTPEVALGMAPRPEVVAVSSVEPKREPVDAEALQRLLGAALSHSARQVIAAVPPAQRAALILGSPDFMRR